MPIILVLAVRIWIANMQIMTVGKVSKELMLSSPSPKHKIQVFDRRCQRSHLDLSIFLSGFCSHLLSGIPCPNPDDSGKFHFLLSIDLNAQMPVS